MNKQGNTFEPLVQKRIGEKDLHHSLASTGKTISIKTGNMENIDCGKFLRSTFPLYKWKGHVVMCYQAPLKPPKGLRQVKKRNPDK